MKTWILIAVTMLVSACDPHPIEDSKSNWLRQCGTTQDCAGAGDCICGVCTKTCAGASGCAGLPDHAAACVSPSEHDLPASCGADSTPKEQKVCLVPCATTGECGARQTCLHGVCVSKALLSMDTGAQDSGALVDGFDAGPSAPPRTDANLPPIKTTPPPVVSMPDEDDAGTCDCHKSACTCESGLVCHLDGLCSEPGTVDSLGFAAFSNAVSDATPLFAADDKFVYGLHKGSIQSSIARWPLHGGNGQDQVMAGGQHFFFNHHFPALVSTNINKVTYELATTQLPVIADADRIYFVAGGDSSELSNSLWSMPKDDSAAPTRHGLAGSVIAQDADFLYFSNDGDSRVLRLSKTALDDTPEQIYASAADAPLTILLIAVNTSSVFVTELPPHATDRTKYSVKIIDKASKDVKELSTSDRFTTDAWNSFATDAYFMMVGEQASTDNQGIDRLDLATTQVKPLGGEPQYASFADGYVYASGEGGSWGLWRFDIASAHATEVLHNRKIGWYSTLGVAGGVFAVATYGTVGTLVRLNTP